MQTTKIVVIDDEVEILSTLERFLSRKGKYSVKTYSNPLTALASLDKDTNLILLDVMMPQINGIDLIPKLKAKYPRVKIIIMTAYSTLQTVLDAQRNGANDYIMKPFKSLNDISSKIESVL